VVVERVHGTRTANARRPRAASVTARPDAIGRLHRQIGNRAVAGTLQRAVGFELEDAFWRPWRRTWRNRMYPVERQRVLHRGNGFELQADDSPGPTRSNIEFVTVPFEESTAGINALRTTMQAIRAVVTGGLNPNVGGLGPEYPDNAPPHPYDAARYVPATTIGLTGSRDLPASRTYFSRGVANGQFKVQATAGIGLDKLAGVMEYLGTNPPGETPAQTLERGPARAALYAPVPEPVLNVLGGARTLAGQVLTAMGNDLVNYTVGERATFTAIPPALEGFVASVLATMKLLQLPLPGVIKYRTALMPRTSYAAMLASLAPAQKAGILRNPASFADHLVAVSNATPLLPAVGPINGDTGLTVGSPFIRQAPTDPSQAAFGAITIADWIAGMARGRDFLTPADMDRELRRRGSGRGARRAARDLLESFGTIGGMDVRGGAPGLAVFEQRTIKPGVPQIMGGPYLTIDEAYRLVWNQLLFFRRVRRAANAGTIGTYPSRPRGVFP
jgi:hypothetical protein